MDRLDRKILRLLQEDSTLAVADVAKKVGLSTTPCWRRIQKLEEEGVIRRRVAILDPVKINARVTVFVSIRTNSHSNEWLKRNPWFENELLPFLKAEIAVRTSS